MRLVLVGADYEENLGMGMIAAAAAHAGHTVEVVAFNDRAALPRVARRVLEGAPDVVGLAMQFQHRAFEFLELGARLRESGFLGHLTCGGQFPTLAWREVLSRHAAMDSIVLHEGEHTIVELLSALTERRPLAEVPGLAVRDVEGVPTRTAGRALTEDLDALPLPVRYRSHTLHAGVPFIPIVGGRGCWGSCSYCAITSVHRDAREYGGAKLLRLRSPENLAGEMALAWHSAGGQAIFCFHDDNLLLPRPEATLARMKALRSELDALGVGRVGIIGKCRPECLTPSLARELRALGVIRLYVGVENASRESALRLRRGPQHAAIEGALRACREAGIFTCYNLLVFEPGATLEDVRANVAFIRAHASHPMNFCRAEPYHGTPLYEALAERGALTGSYLGWDYRLEDDRAELLFRVCSAAFRPRNFATEGVANRYMGLGYLMKVIEHFHDVAPDRLARLGRRVEQLTRAIALDTADFLEEALALAEGADLSDASGIERETALLGLRIAAKDATWHAALDTLFSDLEAAATRSAQPRLALRPPAALTSLARRMALGVSLAASAAGLQGCSATVADPVPSDAPVDVPRDTRAEIPAPDPVPPDSGMDVTVVDIAPADSGVDLTVVDLAPPDSGVDVFVVDAVPPDSGVDSGARDAPGDAPSSASLPAPPRLPVVEHWRNTTPTRARRASTLPLWAPPTLELQAKREGELLVVSLVGGPEAITTRWEGEGELEARGREARWTPTAPGDLLRVAVRAKGGVAVITLRARDVS